MSQVSEANAPLSPLVGAAPEKGSTESMQQEFVQSRIGGPYADAASASGPTALFPQGGQLPSRAEGTASVASAPTGSPSVGAPAEYDLAIAESVQASIPQEKMDEFTHYARAAGLSNEQAQAALDFKIQLNRDYEDTHRQQVDQWEKQVRADPELGGKNVDVTIATATRAMQHYDPTGHISKLLCESGHGSNPEVVRFLYNIGKSLGEDKVPFSNSSVRSDASLGERMYPNFKF